MKRAVKAPAQVVLMATDGGGFSIATLGLAVRMAASMEAPLQGLFVEDEDLIQITGLPISREISRTTARERPTDVEGMRRALRTLAAKFETSLKREASASQVGYSFEYVRGRIRDIGLESRAGTGYMILDRNNPSMRSKSSTVPARILWLTADPAQEISVLHALMENFSQRRIELTLASDNPEVALANGFRHLSENRADDLPYRQCNVHHLLEKLGKHVEFDFAVLSRGAAKDRLAAILNALRCPVILVA